MQGKISTTLGIIIIVAAILILFGGVFAFQYYLVDSQQINQDNQAAEWQTYTNTEHGFEIKYPKDFTILEENQSITLEFPSSYEKMSYKFNNDVENASIFVGLNIPTIGDLDVDNWCQDFENNSDKYIKLNDVDFIRDTVGSSAMGGRYTEYTIYKTLRNDECYYIGLIVNGDGPGAGANNGVGPISEDYANPSDKDNFISIFEQVLSTFKFMTSSDQTSDWQTYTSTEYGFEFKYPQDWTALQSASSNELYLLYVYLGPKDSIQEGGVYTLDLRNVDEFLPNADVSGRSNTTLGGENATIYEFKGGQKGIIVDRGNYLIEFWEAVSEYSDIYQKMVSTFRFIK